MNAMTSREMRELRRRALWPQSPVVPFLPKRERLELPPDEPQSRWARFRAKLRAFFAPTLFVLGCSGCVARCGSAKMGCVTEHEGNEAQQVLMHDECKPCPPPPVCPFPGGEVGQSILEELE